MNHAITHNNPLPLAGRVREGGDGIESRLKYYTLRLTTHITAKVR